MPVKELIHSKEELDLLAEAMYQELSASEGFTISRYIHMSSDSISFKNGRKSRTEWSNAVVNKEHMDSQIYSSTHVDILSPDTFRFATVQRDLNLKRFNFDKKEIDSSIQDFVSFEEIPVNVGMYDRELQEFSERHPDAKVYRELQVQQQVFVNSEGRKIIQSIPFFGIHYTQGFQPVQTNRDIVVVCNTDDDLRRLPEMIKHIPDPTPDRKIARSKSFAEAFENLYNISALKFGSLADAGIPLKLKYDVMMLTGVPIHEIFGHHFEEPIQYLDFGQSGTFKYGQQLEDKNLLLTDNPHHKIAGFRPYGFTNVDSYGKVREAQTHIRDGEIVGFLGSEYADTKKLSSFMEIEDSQFEGGALQYLDGHFPQNRMTCTVLDGKGEDIDLEGKLVVVSHSGETDPRVKTYAVYGDEAYVVQGGEARRIIPIQVTGGINQALGNLVLTNDWTYQTGMCGKPQPISGIHGRASVPVSQFTRNQVWQGQQVYPKPISDDHLTILQE